MSTHRIGVPSAVRRWWALVVLLTGAGGLLGYAYSSSVTPVYEADVTLVVQQSGGSAGGQGTAGLLVPTYAELVRSGPVLEAAIARLRLSLSPAQLAPDVRGESDSETRLLTIRARNRDPAVAAALADALAAELRRFVHSQGATGRPVGGTIAPGVRLEILERGPNPARVRPESGLTMEFGALAGLFGALAVAVLVELRRRVVRDEHELAETGFPVLGSVDGGALARRRLSAPALGLPSSQVGSYDLLAARISPGGNGGAPKSLLVLGTQAGDRSATVALNLALALAETDTRVAVADVGRRREVTRLAIRSGLHSPRDKRIGSARNGKVAFDRFRLGGSRLLVLAVLRSADPGRTSWEQAQALVGLLLGETDFLIVHAASLRRSPDALAWARAVDATVVVARRERTKREGVEAALEGLEHARTNVLGTVLHTA
jgi:polysaccharide biosynthesis transport protein